MAQRRDRDGRYAAGPVAPPTASDTPVTPPAAPQTAQNAPSDPTEAQLRYTRARASGVVAPVPCRRCQGTGFVTARREHQNIPGLCFRCHGVGMEESDPDILRVARQAAREKKAADEAYRRRMRAAFERIRAEVPRFVPFADHDTAPSRHTVEGGLHTLETLEPERHKAALQALVDGHPQVLQALHDYFLANAHRLEINGGPGKPG